MTRKNSVEYPESISSSSEAIQQWEELVKDETNHGEYKEDNKMLIIFPWKCPVTDARKVTCVVPLPSGIVPEEVEFSFEGGNPFQTDTFSLKYAWPEKALQPEVIFRVDMRADKTFVHKSEFVEFREAIRRIKSSEVRSEPTSRIVIKLPFMVQRSRSSFTKDMRMFGTSNSAVLARDKVKKEFVSLKDMAKSTTSVDHKVYFMILRFTGTEIEEEDMIDKRVRCVQDCDDSSDEDYDRTQKYKDHLSKDLYFEELSSSVYRAPKRTRRR